jgi:hypothetical protein
MFSFLGEFVTINAKMKIINGDSFAAQDTMVYPKVSGLIR